MLLVMCISYACVFDLRQAASKILSTGLVSLNGEMSRCKLTGFLPIHAVTANGLRGTYEWMKSELPFALRANDMLLSTSGKMPDIRL